MLACVGYLVIGVEDAVHDHRARCGSRDDQVPVDALGDVGSTHGLLALLRQPTVAVAEA